MQINSETGRNVVCGTGKFVVLEAQYRNLREIIVAFQFPEGVSSQTNRQRIPTHLQDFMGGVCGGGSKK